MLLPSNENWLSADMLQYLPLVKVFSYAIQTELQKYTNEIAVVTKLRRTYPPRRSISTKCLTISWTECFAVPHYASLHTAACSVTGTPSSGAESVTNVTENGSDVFLYYCLGKGEVTVDNYRNKQQCLEPGASEYKTRIVFHIAELFFLSAWGISIKKRFIHVTIKLRLRP
jgi:hypothetical protein